ncbi:hypothetical protein MKX03_026166 [Papaver bracteatum]|nr:hypothetical protein MKX03_026166 [Papaver bracteatum]
MAKISIFVCLLLFVLITMPTSSSSRMMLQQVTEVVTKCPGLTKVCSATTGCRGACPPVQCPKAQYSAACCGCLVCCF